MVSTIASTVSAGVILGGLGTIRNWARQVDRRLGRIERKIGIGDHRG